MKEVILCKYGEIILKGANKSTFESILLKEVKRRAKAIGNYSVRYMQSTVYVEPLDIILCSIDNHLSLDSGCVRLIDITKTNREVITSLIGDMKILEAQDRRKMVMRPVSV